MIPFPLTPVGEMTGQEIWTLLFQALFGVFVTGNSWGFAEILRFGARMVEEERVALSQPGTPGKYQPVAPDLPDFWSGREGKSR